ncbi:hypothetical protein ACFLXH_01170 [Chloroflexota bacterium]
MSKLVLFLSGIFLLIPCPIVYAYDNSADVQPPRVEIPTPAESPDLHTFGKAIGSVTPGTLFYVDCVEYPGDTKVALSLINSDELIHYYRYLLLNIGLYLQSGEDTWEKVNDTGSAPGYYLSMKSAEVFFTLPAYAKYKMTVDGGSYYCVNSPLLSSGLAPKFYLAVE